MGVFLVTKLPQRLTLWGAAAKRWALMRQAAKILWLWAVLSGVTLGCGRIERTRECRALTGAVNATLAETAALADAAKPDKKAIAERYFRLAEKIRGMKFSNPGVAKAAKDYATLMEDTGFALDLDRKMPPRGDGGPPRPRPSMARFTRRERTMVARINSLCESP